MPQIRFLGLSEVFEQQRRVQLAVAIGADLDLAPRRYLGVFENDVQERFRAAPALGNSAVVLGNATWMATRPGYRNFTGQTLTDTGRLRRSLRIGSPENEATTSPSELTFGTRVPYAGFVGGLRPFVFVYPELLDILEEEIGRANAEILAGTRSGKGG